MKKVLVITYYWPPAGGPGVQRWLKFVKYLRDFNIEPVIYIPKNPQYPLVDKSFVNDIPKDIKVYSNPIFEPYRLASIFSTKKTKRISSGIISTKNQSFLEKVLLWIRGNLFIPDARRFWVKPSVSYLNRVIQKERIETIITTGPPHSVHLIGYHLKRSNPIRWIADFRDPWTSIGYHKKLKLTSYAKRKHQRLESLVLNQADTIIVTSKTTQKEFELLTKKPIVVITNGFDNTRMRGVELDEKFTISHIGSMLTGRNPENLWRILSELSQDYPDFKKALRLQFIGVVSNDVLHSLALHGLTSAVEVLGYVPHETALNFQEKSQVLLLVEIDSEETKGIIPGKLFEYLSAKRPILGVGPEGWDVKDIVSETNSGAVFGYWDTVNLKNVILTWFETYQSEGLHISSKNIDQYSRRELTRNLAAYI